MAEIKGKRVTCDRCGSFVFLKKLGDIDHDGGFSPPTEQFESLPETWLYTSQIGHLCSHCAGRFRAFIDKLMDGSNKNVAPAWKLQDEDVRLLDLVEIKEEF